MLQNPQTAGQTYNEQAATIYKFWLANGFSPAQACGLLAQADAESALDPKAVGDHGQAFGIDQWHASRVDAIRNGCGVDLSKLPPLADQLTAALWELNHTEKSGGRQIKAATTAFDAGHDAARFWERPDPPRNMPSAVRLPKMGGLFRQTSGLRRPGDTRGRQCRQGPRILKGN